MGHRLLICGGNGAGKSTLGRLLARQTGWPFFDVEDYYFSGKGGDYAYSYARTREEVTALLLADLRTHDHMMFAAVKGDFGPEAMALFTGAVVLCAPKELRLRRVIKRSRLRFGKRMLPGGDLYAQEQCFFDMVQRRSDQAVEDALKQLTVPILRLDATLSPEQNAASVVQWLAQQT